MRELRLRDALGTEQSRARSQDGRQREEFRAGAPWPSSNSPARWRRHLEVPHLTTGIEAQSSKHEVQMTITRINQFEAKPGAEEKLYAFLQSVISIILTCPGCISCRLLRSTENPACLAI